jgi:hypothetical protein
MDLSLHPDLMPNRAETHKHDRVKVLELGVADREVLKVEVLRVRRTPKIRTHQRMIAFELNEHGLHALGDCVLTPAHEVSHGLVHLHHLGLAGHEGRLDVVVVAGRSA